MIALVWQQRVYLAYVVLGTLYMISVIGKPREPATPEAAVGAAILYGLLAWLVLSIPA